MWKTDGVRIFDADGVMAKLEQRPTRNRDAYLMTAAPLLLAGAEKALKQMTPGACPELEAAVRAARGDVWK